MNIIHPTSDLSSTPLRIIPEHVTVYVDSVGEALTFAEGEFDPDGFMDHNVEAMYDYQDFGL